MLGRLRHPNIAQVFEAGVHDDERGAVPFFAMELIPDARPLIEYADAEKLTVRQRLELFADVCDAVHHGHQKGIIHRDLKPSNILVGRDSEPKVIDFGVARSTDADIMLATQCTQTGDLVGTVHYMSPEQCDGDSSIIDTRSDVYSLGVVLYELLSGAAPYDTSGTTLYTAVRTIKEALPRRPSETSRRLRGDIEAILLKTLEKNPARRYDSAAALAKDIRGFLAGDPVSAHIPGAAYRIGRYVQRRPWQAGLFASLVLLLLLGTATVLVWNARNDAVHNQTMAEVGSYGAKLSAADAAIGINDPAAARALLEQARDASPDLCGWEWRHLMSRVDQSIRSIPAQARNPTDSDTTDVAISPDGKWIATVRPNGTLEILNSDGALFSTLIDAAQSTRSANTVAWSYDGTLLAAASTDGKNERGSPIGGLNVWRTDDLSAREPDAHWPVGEACKPTLAFHPSRLLLATDGRDGERGLIKLWDLEHFGEGAQNSINIQPQVISGVGLVHECLAWSQDGDLMASVAMEDMEIQIWDFSKAPHVLPAEPITILRGHTYHILDLAFSPGLHHERILASASLDGTVRLWDLRDIRTPADPSSQTTSPPVDAFDILRGHGRGAISVCFDSWGRRLFVGDLDRTLHVWDVEQISELSSGKARRTRMNTLRGHDTRINRIRSLSDGRVTSVSSDGELKIWAPDAEDVPLLRGHTSTVHAAAFSPGSPTLFTVGAKRTFL